MQAFIAGQKYLHQFLENITNQTIFDDRCELIIIDANSPEREFAAIEPYLQKYPNIRYERINYRIGIYDAWNMGIEIAKGEYITNTNLDDMRRNDSLELQAATLDANPFTDIVYQDFFYTYDWAMTFEQIAAVNIRSQLPIITPHNLLLYNSPHNGPMWRKSIHDDVGLFDTGYVTAGDFEFWLRCLAAGKNFYKINDPHIAYYHNPGGLSTKAESLGVVEARRATARHSAQLLKSELFDHETMASGLGCKLATHRGGAWSHHNVRCGSGCDDAAVRRPICRPGQA